eukprot:GEMP01030050.1.p1 GENE.GEMP01030050.1~~GEMP01030050.1.p1  ORF type:complete len:238 (+),score=84.52 GEMP01030050.1:156-869(+)
MRFFEDVRITIASVADDAAPWTIYAKEVYYQIASTDSVILRIHTRREPMNASPCAPSEAESPVHAVDVAEAHVPAMKRASPPLQVARREDALGGKRHKQVAQPAGGVRGEAPLSYRAPALDVEEMTSDAESSDCVLIEPLQNAFVVGHGRSCAADACAEVTPRSVERVHDNALALDAGRMGTADVWPRVSPHSVEEIMPDGNTRIIRKCNVEGCENWAYRSVSQVKKSWLGACSLVR